LSRDLTLTRHSAKNSGYGYQKPDYTRVLDGDQKPILCTQCGTSSGHKRQMLKCDFCHAHWHLDCLDPPLANPPHISLEASQRDAWRCPRHLEHDLRSGQLYQNDLNGLDDDDEMADTPLVSRVARKIRKRKNTKVIEPTFARGMRNNGLIDIINNDNDGEFNYVFGPDDPKDLNSKVFRVPEKGVILDFVSKVKRYVHLSYRVTTTAANVSYSARVRKHSGEHNSTKAAAQHKASMQNFITRPMAQQQAALNLARLANRETDIGLSEGKLDVLLFTLTVRPLPVPHFRCFRSPALTRIQQAEADKDVTAALDNAAPPSVDAGERAQLLKLQELIARRLNG
jgi:hypothetical protein